MTDVQKLRRALYLILDNVDYTAGACSPTEMIGAILPHEFIVLAHRALEETKHD